MAVLRALSGLEICRLASGLIGYEWSWDMAFAPEFVTAFGWEVEAVSSHGVRFNDGFGMASGYVRGRNGNATSIELQVTGFSDRDPESSDAVHDAFSRMAAALSSTLGEAAARKPGASPEIRWAGAGSTLRLVDRSIVVQLELILNSALAEHDEIVELEERGLL